MVSGQPYFSLKQHEILYHAMEIQLIIEGFVHEALIRDRVLIFMKISVFIFMRCRQYGYHFGTHVFDDHQEGCNMALRCNGSRRYR